MKTKYGTFGEQQMRDYKTVLHKSIHKLLCFKEENYPHLNRYFTILLFQINGLNETLNYPTELVTIISLLEAARLESLKPECDFSVYRKAVLDAHTLIDKLPER